jgi:hypothetical protein
MIVAQIVMIVLSICGLYVAYVLDATRKRAAATRERAGAQETEEQKIRKQLLTDEELQKHEQMFHRKELTEKDHLEALYKMSVNIRRLAVQELKEQKITWGSLSCKDRHRAVVEYNRAQKERRQPSFAFLAPPASSNVVEASPPASSNVVEASASASSNVVEASPHEVEASPREVEASPP